MGNYPLIVIAKRPSKSQSLRILVVDLVRLLRPREEEPARAAVLQAIRGGTFVEVELGLDESGQPCNAKVLPPVASPCRACNEGADRFGLNSCHLAPTRLTSTQLAPTRLNSSHLCSTRVTWAPLVSTRLIAS